MPERSIAVVGAAGYVGQHLLADLARRGHRVTAIMRGAPEMFLTDDAHEAVHPNKIGGRTFDVVVNLAFPSSNQPHDLPRLNAALVDSVAQLLAPGGQLIHISTQAVFGLALDRPVAVGPVAPVRDVPYVEVKLDAEHAFERLQRERGLRLDIVRFGNVFGPASAIWGTALVQRLLTGRPIGITGQPGYSNMTDVVNAASYVAHLATASSRPATGAEYHHLAEMSETPWPWWIDAMAEDLGVDVVTLPPSVLAMPSGAAKELVGLIEPFKPRPLWRFISQERAAGSWGRSLRRRVPRAFPGPDDIAQVRAAQPAISRQEQTFLAIMSGQQQFVTSVQSDWTPPLDREASRQRFLDWMR